MVKENVVFFYKFIQTIALGKPHTHSLSWTLSDAYTDYHFMHMQILYQKWELISYLLINFTKQVYNVQ